MKTTKEIFNIIKKYPNRNLIILRWYAEIAIRNWRDEHCPFTPDWTDRTQRKWYQCYNHEIKGWDINFAYMWQEPRTIYFATGADIQACSEALPDEWNALLID